MAQESEPEPTAQPLTMYSHPSERYHIVIPPEWIDFSTPTYALMERGFTRIFARSTRAADAESAAAESIPLFLPGLEIEPASTENLILSNGTWTRILYPMVEAGALTIYVQSYEGVHYVIGMMNGDGGVPVIVPMEDAQAEGAAEAAATAAVALVNPEATRAADTDGAFTVFGQNYLPIEFESADGSPLTAWTRLSGRNAYVYVTPVGGTPHDAAFFTVLLDFFLTPETTEYFILGVVVVIVIMVFIVGSMILRARNLRKDLRTLEQLTPSS